MLTFEHKGAGLVNSLINKLPVELHIPGYQYCGPGTKLEKRLKRGDPGINALDSACKEHDIAYSNNKTLEDRHKADWILENRAWERVKSKDAKFGEKAAAWLVTTGMKVKRKLGMGIRKKRKQGASFNKALKKARLALKHSNPTDLLSAANIALKSVKTIGKYKKPRVIAIPKTGGFLPLIPIFAGLSALGALAGGASGIAKAVNDAKAAKEKLKEEKRHNMAMEQKPIGNGLYLKPYKKGFGLFLKKQQKNYQ